MVSYKNFFSICMMMAVLLFMFQFFQVAKESGSGYDRNEYMEEEPLSGSDRWQAGEASQGGEGSSAGVQLQKEGCAVLVGEQDSAIGKQVSWWCTYTKRGLRTVSGPEELVRFQEESPKVLFIDSQAVDFDRETQALSKLAEAGVPLIFCSLPEASVIEENELLQELLGIEEIKESPASLEGIWLFDGFLLGGDAVYRAENQEESKPLDLELQTPWYITGAGTKIYMEGILEGSSPEEAPALLWRNNYKGTMVFAVNGSYLEDETGLGILSGFLYELEPYSLYPVINARNMLVADYPGFAEENRETISGIYSRSLSGLFQDIVWPGLTAMSEREGLKLTCFFTPQYDYEDEEEPVFGNYDFYLRQMKEMGAEAGKSLECRGGIPLEEKLVKDELFWQQTGSEYRFGAFYGGKQISKELEQAVSEGKTEDLRTIACGAGEHPPVSYLNDQVTLQCVTGYGDDFSYSQDLKTRSLETALGYSTLLIDMERVVWPESEEDRWENYFTEVSGNVAAYWREKERFDHTALSESDARVRSFLNLEYEEERQGEQVVLHTANTGKEAYFVLRTHGEEIKEMSGGQYRKLEENAFLLQVPPEETVIILGKAREQLDFYFSEE